MLLSSGVPHRRVLWPLSGEKSDLPDSVIFLKLLQLKTFKVPDLGIVFLEPYLRPESASFPGVQWIGIISLQVGEGRNSSPKEDYASRQTNNKHPLFCR